METTQRIAENIRAIMGRKRVKIKTLAHATKTAYTTMYGYCNGHFSIPPDKLQQIADALGVSLEELIEGEVAHV